MPRMVSSREIIGKRIVAFRSRAAKQGATPETRRVMHDPEIVLDDGSVLVFAAEEHPDGDFYGVWIGRRKPARG